MREVPEPTGGLGSDLGFRARQTQPDLVLHMYVCLEKSLLSRPLLHFLSNKLGQ